jgi:TonB family protein
MEAQSAAGTEEPAGGPIDPERPPPVLPEAAFLLSKYAALELTISAARDGSIQKVVISKPSQAKLYDEYTRDWVEKHWKMPTAKAEEADLRQFIAPIVYPKAQPPPGGFYPPPYYPVGIMQRRETGLVIVEVKVAPSGEIESARAIVSSGHKELDDHTVSWVQRKWKFPPGEKRWVQSPFLYILQR